MNDLLMLSMMLDTPKYGYQLKREAGFITGQTLHNNLVYPALRRFLDEGWVSRKTVPGERGQTRQQYALTGSGRRYLSECLHAFSAADAASEDAFRLRVGLFPVLKADARDAILELREKWLFDRDQTLAALQVRMELGKFGGEVVRYMRKQIEIEGDWIRHLRRIAKTT